MNMIRSLVRRLWPTLSVMGPAPAAPKKDGPASLESSDRGMFDDPDGADAAGDEDPEAGSEDGEEPQGDEDGDDADAEPDGDGEDARDTRAEDEDVETDDDEEEPADGEDDDDGEGEDGADAGDDDAATALRASWESRLDVAARTAGDDRPRLNISRLSLTADARKKFDELRAGDEDGKKDADAIFEVAMDACLQVLGTYHDDVAKPAGQRVEAKVRNIQVGRRLAEFRKSVGAALTPKVEKRMADVYQAWAQKYGWRAVDDVPLADLFRMAGGRKAKAKPAAGKKPAADPAERAREQKRAALGAAGGPRALGRTRPEGGGAAPKGKEDRALREFAQDVRGRTPFFTLG